MSMSLADFMGGSITFTLNANLFVAPGIARVAAITADTVGRQVKLPDLSMTTYYEQHLEPHKAGHPYFWLWNKGVPAFTVVDVNGFGISEALATNKVALVSLYVDTDEAVGRKWHVAIRDKL